ncbi:MAG: sigma-70 family RNA polymerase sigma factor [Planctomycetota bacterium]
MTRDSLLSRARSRNSRAWNELVALYAPLVSHWIRQRGLGLHESEDCLQEVFVALSNSLNRFEANGKSGSFRSWLWTMTLNKIRDQMRTSARREAAKGGSSAAARIQNTIDLSVSADDMLFEDEPTDELELKQLTRRALDQIRDEFAARTWCIFDRSIIDGIATAQVAQEFEVTPATVRKVRSRILRRLRQQLGDLG